MLLEDAQSQKWGCSALCALTHEYSEGRSALGSSGALIRVLEVAPYHRSVAYHYPYSFRRQWQVIQETRASVTGVVQL